jgi:hypothetical protein
LDWINWIGLIGLDSLNWIHLDWIPLTACFGLDWIHWMEFCALDWTALHNLIDRVLFHSRNCKRRLKLGPLALAFETLSLVIGHWALVCYLLESLRSIHRKASSVYVGEIPEISLKIHNLTSQMESM